MATAIAEPPHLTADLRALYLSTVASQWRPLAEQAARQRQAPADYLAQLVHLEVTGRRERRIQRRIQDARFPMLKTLDAFSFEAQPYGSVEAGEGSWVGADGGSPEGDRSRRRPSGDGVGGLGAGATVEREPETRRGVAAAAWRAARRGFA